MLINSSQMRASNLPHPGSIAVPAEGERRNLNSELWHACAGPLVSLPAVGTRVVYLPQGHSEQVAASTQKEADAHIPAYPNLPPQLVCQLHDVILHADIDTDEVYCQMTLQPVIGKLQQEKECFFAPDIGSQSRQPNIFFCKTLTASDTSTHGGFSIPRRAAEKVFPPLDFTMQPPAQELIARDLHDMEWKFRHIYRGQPKRHLLTTGWSVFVSAKRLTAGDSVLFIRNDKGQLLLGIRRAARPQTVLPSSVLSSDSMHIGVLAAAAHASNTNSRFTVFYNPRASPSEFVIPYSKFEKAVYHTRVSVGMRFRMLFETEESSVRRYMGTITGVSDLDPVRWPKSQWRSIKVGWDESTAGERQRRVSLWEIELLTTFLVYPSTANWRLKHPWPETPGASFSSDMEFDSLKRPSMWMQLQNVNTGYTGLAAQQGMVGINPLLGSLQRKSESNVEPNVYDALGAAALQKVYPSKQLHFQPQQQIMQQPNQMLYSAQPQSQQISQHSFVSHLLQQQQQQLLQQTHQQLSQQMHNQQPLQQPHQQLSQQILQQQPLQQPHQQQPLQQPHQQPSPQPHQQLSQKPHLQSSQQQYQQLSQQPHQQLSQKQSQQQPLLEPQQQPHLPQQQQQQQLPLQPSDQLKLLHQQQPPHQQQHLLLHQQQQQQLLPHQSHQKQLPQPHHPLYQQQLTHLYNHHHQQQLPQHSHLSHSHQQHHLPAQQQHHHHQPPKQEEHELPQQQLHQQLHYLQQAQSHVSATESQLTPSFNSSPLAVKNNGLRQQAQQQVLTSQQQQQQQQQLLSHIHALQQSQAQLSQPEQLHQQQPFSSPTVNSVLLRSPLPQSQAVPSSSESTPQSTSTESSSVLSSATGSHTLQSIFGNFAADTLSSHSSASAISTAQSLVQSTAMMSSSEVHQDSTAPTSWIVGMSQSSSGLQAELIDNTKDLESTCTGCGVLPNFSVSASPFNYAIRDACQGQNDLISDLQRQTLFGNNADLQNIVMPTSMPMQESRSYSSSNEFQSQCTNHFNQGPSPIFDMDLSFSSNMLNGGLDEPDFLPALAQANAPVRTYTKVYKSGSVGRSLDVTRFSNYDELRCALARMFGLEGQLEQPRSGWQLIFVDRENDWLLLGDDPWEFFINNVRSIKILSPSEVLQMQDGTGLLPVQRQANSSSEGDMTQQDSRNPSSIITSTSSLDY